jgi:hypothetical protein
MRTNDLSDRNFSVDAALRRRLVCIAVRDYLDETEEFKEAIDRQADVVEGWFARKLIDAEMRFTSLRPHRINNTRDLRNFVDDERLYECQCEDVLVVYITGHGIRGSANRHFLLLPTTDESKLLSTAFPTAELVGAILDSDAEHVLILIDSCFAGTLDIELAAHLQDLAHDRRGLDGLAVVTSGDFQDRPRVGEFTEVIQLALQRISDEASGFAGPDVSFQEWEYVLREVANERKDLIAVNWVWPRSRSNNPSPCLPNLGFWQRRNGHRVSGVRDVAENQAQTTSPSYWISRASGSTAEDDANWYFTGRTKLIDDLRSLLGSAYGICVVTGETGSGKSAVLAQLVVHGNRHVREEAHRSNTLSLDNGPFPSVDVAVLARNKSSTMVVSEIREALRALVATAPRNTSIALHDLVLHVEKGMRRPVTLVIDGVDEAIDPQELISDLLPLIRHPDGKRQRVCAIFGVRSPRPGDVAIRGDSTLVDELCRIINTPSTGSLDEATSETFAQSIEGLADTTADWEEILPLVFRTDGDEAETDIRAYAYRLLRDAEFGDSPYRLDHASALEVAKTIARRVAPSFLNARLAADRARRGTHVQDVRDIRWLATLQDGTVALLHSDVEEVAENSRIPASDLLAGLQACSFSCGLGLPWSDVWPTVYRAIHPSGSSDVDAVLRELRTGRLSGYLFTDVSDDRMVYRPTHEGVAEELRETAYRNLFGQGDGANPNQKERLIHSRITLSLADLVRKHLPYAPHPYVRRHLVEHAARGEVLDDAHIPIAFLEWDTSRLLESYLAQRSAEPQKRALCAWARIERHLGGIDVISQRGSHAFHLTALGGRPPPLSGWMHPAWAAWPTQSNVFSAGPHGTTQSVCDPAGEILFTCNATSSDHVVEVRSIRDGALRTNIPTGPIVSMCATTGLDRTLLVTHAAYSLGSVAARYIEIWSESGERLNRIACGRIRQLQGLSSRQHWVAAICERFGEEVVVWDAESGELVHRLGGVAAGSFCDLGAMNGASPIIAVADLPKRSTQVHLWDVEAGEVLKSFETGPIGAMMKVSGEHGQVVLATMANPYGKSEIRFWDIETGICSRTLDVGPIRTFSCVPSGAGRDFLVTAGSGGIVSLYDLWSGHELEQLVTVEAVNGLSPVPSSNGRSTSELLISGTSGFAVISLGRTR